MKAFVWFAGIQRAASLGKTEFVVTCDSAVGDSTHRLAVASSTSAQN